MRIFHVADSYLDADYHEAGPVGLLDIRAGFERAVQAAIDHRADIFLHAGGLFGSVGDVADTISAVWLESCFSRLYAAGIVPVVHETGFELFRAGCEILPQDGRIMPAGMSIASGLEAASDEVVDIRCVWGAIDRIPTARGDANLPWIDAQDLAECSASYVALAGTRRPQLVQPNAAYSGPTAALDRFCEGARAGILVEIGPSTGQVLSMKHVILPGRKVLRIAVDGSGMGAERLGHAINDHITAALKEHEEKRLEVMDRLATSQECPDLVERINEIYGRPDTDTAAGGMPATSWVPHRPLVVVGVDNALEGRRDVWAAEPRLGWFVEQNLVCQLIVDFGSGREYLIDHAPVRDAAFNQS